MVAQGRLIPGPHAPKRGIETRKRYNQEEITSQREAPTSFGDSYMEMVATAEKVTFDNGVAYVISDWSMKGSVFSPHA